MISNGIKKYVAAAVVVLMTATSFAQMTSGKIVFYRKMNLKKMFKDNPRVAPMLNDDITWNVDSFALYFDENRSAFLPIEGDEMERGMMKMLTPQNSTYKNLAENERTVEMVMMGTPMTIKDTVKQRVWKVTDSRRRIAGYMCRKSVLEINDTTRLYAWFTSDIVPAIGPEGFDGLPGAILGFANEEGSIVYFAKRVEAMEPSEETMTPQGKSKDVFKEDELKALLLERMGKWIKKEDLDAQFEWL